MTKACRIKRLATKSSILRCLISTKILLSSYNGYVLLYILLAFDNVVFLFRNALLCG